MPRPKYNTKSPDYLKAMDKVEANINKICTDRVVNLVVTKIRERLSIDNDVYKNLQEKSNKIDKIYNPDKLIKILTEEWIMQLFCSEKNKKALAELIAKREAMREHKNTSRGQAEINKLAKQVSENNIVKYLKRQIETYPLSDLFVTFPARINLKIWKPIVDLRLFNVPAEKILKFKKDILEKHYLPEVFTRNGDIYIKINELTTQADIAVIWESEVQKIKDRYTAKYQYESVTRGGKNERNDRIILELYECGLKPKDISIKLSIKHDIKMEPDKITKRLKEIKKRSRFKEKEKLILRYCE